MEPTRFFAIIALISLPTVMFGGYSLRRLLETPPGISEFQRTYFRAGHAHAGVLLVLSLVYNDYLDRTTISNGLQWLACIVLVIGILAQSGGFFLHMAKGEPGRVSIGTTVTTVGFFLLAVAMLFLAYGLIAEWP
ncbi:MAG: hypothetical protein ACJ789_03955 [Thermomicrobiales bacterium]